MEKHSHDELNKLFEAGKKADSKFFSEARTNYLLHNGEHWKRFQDDKLERIRRSGISEQSKLRLTKNHIQVVTKTYINNCLAEAPGVHCEAYNVSELADTKDAQLSQAVWENAEIHENMDEKTEKFVTSFFVGGEAVAFIYFNPQKGKLLGFEQKLDEQGQPLFKTADGKETAEQVNPLDGSAYEPVTTGVGKFEGKLCIDLVHPFNLIRPENAESLKECAWLGIEEMLEVSEAKAIVEAIEDEAERKEKLKYIETSGEQSFKVFDTNKGNYSDSDGKVLFKKMFWRPCGKYPLGWYSIFTDSGEIFSGELPLADVLGDEAFPIVTECCDEVPTHPRGFSIIKPIKAPQANLNSLASQSALAALVMGDDKVINFAGAKMSKGQQWAGLREWTVAGNAPTVIPGRAGEQFEQAIARETAELYRLAMMEYEAESKGVQDPMAMLYSNLRQRKKYSMYVNKVARFQVNVASKYLAFARHYLPDEALVRAVGKREAINIPEFKRSSEAGYNIKVKSISQDLESTMGQFMEIQNILQYVGKDLPPNIRNKIISRMPFLNKSEAIDDLMLDENNITSDILAMDRGEYRPAGKYDKHEDYVSRLTNRIKQSDFRMLPQNIQQMYEQKKQEHEQMIAKNAAELKQLQSEFIPTGGGLAKIDIYDPETGKRAIVPTQSLEWLIQTLQKQGAGQESLGQQAEQNQINILQQAQQLAGQQQQGNAMPGPQQPMPMPPQ